MSALAEMELTDDDEAAATGTSEHPRRRRRWRKRVAVATVVAVVAGAAGAGGWFWYGQRSTDQAATVAAAEPTRQLVAVTTGEIVTSVSAEGTVAAAETESLSFSTAGTVTAVNVAVGDTVAAGDVLATIDSPSLQQSLAEAQASEADAKATLVEDVEALAEDDEAVSAEQLAADQARYDVAYDTLVDAYTAYVERDLTASVAGTITAVNLTTGEELASGGSGGTSQTGSASGSGNTTDSLGSSTASMGGMGTTSTSSSAQVEIVSAGRYTVELAVDSAEIDSVAVGQSVTLSESTGTTTTGGFPGGGGFPNFGGGGGMPAVGGGGGFPGQTNTDGGTDDTAETEDDAATAVEDGFSVTGTVTEVASVADASSGVASYTVSVEFDDTSGEVYIGSSVVAEIETARRTDVVQVQSQAVTTDADGNATVVVAVDGTVDGATETRTVTTGEQSGNMIEITSGLEVGDRVIIEITIPTGAAGAGRGTGGQLPEGIELPEGFEPPTGGFLGAGQ